MSEQAANIGPNDIELRDAFMSGRPGDPAPILRIGRMVGGRISDVEFIQPRVHQRSFFNRRRLRWTRPFMARVYALRSYWRWLSQPARSSALTGREGEAP